MNEWEGPEDRRNNGKYGERWKRIEEERGKWVDRKREDGKGRKREEKLRNRIEDRG